MTPPAPSTNGTGWFATPNTVIDDYAGSIGPTAYLVYSTLRRFANKEGACWPSITTLAKITKLTRRGVQMNIKRLIDAGMVQVEASRGGRGKQATNRYILQPLTTHEKDESGFTLAKVSANGGAPLGVNLDALLGVNVGAPKEDHRIKTNGTIPEEREAAEPPTLPDRLLELVDGWNQLGPDIVRPGNGARRDPLSQAVLAGWKSAHRNQEQREAFEDIPRLLTAIRGARFCHRQGWFSLPWLFAKNDKREFNVSRVLAGAHNGDGNGDAPSPAKPRFLDGDGPGLEAAQPQPEKTRYLD